MITLAVDSTAKIAACAVARDEQILASFRCDNGLTQSELLLPMAEAVMQEAGLSYADVDLFACTAGPGSFTGVRIGVAMIKGLAFGRNAACVGVSTLEALAQNLFPLTGIYCPVMDARRGQVYNALFRAEDGNLVRLTPDRAISIADLAAELRTSYPDSTVLLCGDGVDVVRDSADTEGISLGEVPSLLLGQNADSVIRCALRAYRRCECVDDASLRPTYLRLPQAERERLEREKKAIDAEK